MSLAKPVVYDGRLQRSMSPGDTLSQGELVQTLTTAQLSTLSGANMLGPLIYSTTAVAAISAVVPSAADLITAASSGLGNSGIEPGTTWRLRVANAVAAATTAAVVTLSATANTGATVTHGVVNCASVKDFLVTVTNGTPAQTYAVNSTSGSAVLTGLTAAQTATLSVGMVVTTNALNVQAATIISVQPGVGVTLSGNANATSTGTSLTFSPSYTVFGIGQGLV